MRTSASVWLSMIAGLMLSVSPALAHHPFAAEFDGNKPVTLMGTVTRIDWANPHVYAYLDVKDDQGKMTKWKIELGGPSELTSHGWTRSTLMMGQVITVDGWRAKDGTNYANAGTITMPDGKKMSAVSSHDYDTTGTTGKTSKKPSPKQPSPY